MGDKKRERSNRVGIAREVVIKKGDDEKAWFPVGNHNTHGRVPDIVEVHLDANKDHFDSPMPCLPPPLLLAEIQAARAGEDGKEGGERGERRGGGGGGGDERDGISSCDRNHLSLGSGDSDDSAL